jgi:hypothetical protein
MKLLLALSLLSLAAFVPEPLSAPDEGISASGGKKRDGGKKKGGEEEEEDCRVALSTEHRAPSIFFAGGSPA